MKKNLKDYNIDDLKEIFVALDEKAYRAEQVFNWIYKENVTNIDDMTNLSLDLREKLNNEFSLHNFNISKKLESKDGTKNTYLIY